jgi:hypothetical protein
MVVNDEPDRHTRDDASNEHAAKREEVTDTRSIGPTSGRGLIGRLNVMICHRSAGESVVIGRPSWGSVGADT